MFPSCTSRDKSVLLSQQRMAEMKKRVEEDVAKKEIGVSKNSFLTKMQLILCIAEKGWLIVDHFNG